MTSALVARLVADQFPEWADLAVTPVESGGWDNYTFRLGDELLVRLPSGPSYAAQVPKEHRWLPFLAPLLPLPIPQPVAMGQPAGDYPWPWSVYRWLPGEPARVDNVTDLQQVASDVATFLQALQRIDAAGGPPPGAHNFWRGGPLGTYDGETRTAIAALHHEIDVDAVTRVWELAMASVWARPDVWVHGDIAAGNLLVVDGWLSSVIDFGCLAVGDPACDLTIAWTLLDHRARAAFRAGLDLDPGVWRRARGWALWKALITILQSGTTAADARRTLSEVLTDQATE